ncbi:hypothetical protein L596_002832 [Steinernema carpocapsae]|uniref:Lipid-binding serum glycoprotein N-terminal domain-containing protein n=1 Tax=Steinernema carpocapsae TaxID=34508 RepID=A0A4U8US86_STECR|nr:hypothetical protein L596_002832 [Steinernema carpocapsae]
MEERISAEEFFDSQTLIHAGLDPVFPETIEWKEKTFELSAEKDPADDEPDPLQDLSSILTKLLEKDFEELDEMDEAKRMSKSLKDEVEEGKAGIAVRLTKRALISAAQNVTNFLVHDISQLSIADITLKSMDLNITLHGIKTHSYVAPAVDISVEDGAVVLKTSKGSVDLYGQYKAIYKTIREGVIEAKMSGFDVNLNLRLAKHTKGSLNVAIDQCDASIDSVHVDLIRHLLDQVTSDVRELLHELSSSSICKYLTTYVQKLNEQLNRIMALRDINIHSSMPQGQMQFDLTMSDNVELVEDHIDIPMFGEFARSAQRTPFKPSKLMKRLEDQEKMVYVYISDFIVNSFFYQLEAMVDWKTKLHRIPEVAAALRLECGESEYCLGQHLQSVDNYVPNSGRMYGTVQGHPQVSLTDCGAHLQTNLSVEVTFQTKQESAPRTVIKFNVALKFHIDSFTLLTNETSELEGELRYKVIASGGIDDLQVRNTESFDEKWSFVEMTLQQIATYLKPKLEVMLRQNLHTVLALPESMLPAISSMDGHFRKRTLVLGFDVHMQSTMRNFLDHPDVFNS